MFKEKFEAFRAASLEEDVKEPSEAVAEAFTDKDVVVPEVVAVVENGVVPEAAFGPQQDKTKRAAMKNVAEAVKTGRDAVKGFLGRFKRSGPSLSAG